MYPLYAPVLLASMKLGLLQLKLCRLMQSAASLASVHLALMSSLMWWALMPSSIRLDLSRLRFALLV